MQHLEEKKYSYPVSIGDAKKAVTLLRSYGATEEEASNIISHESVIAIYDYGKVPKNAIAPELIEIFGVQHINDALTYAYLYMDEFDINFELYKDILITLLQSYRPEELIINPEIIRCFITSFINTISYEDISPAEYLERLDCSEIIRLVNSFDQDEDYDNDEDKDYDDDSYEDE